jgi:hypothetical protein
MRPIKLTRIFRICKVWKYIQLKDANGIIYVVSTKWLLDQYDGMMVTESDYSIWMSWKPSNFWKWLLFRIMF